MEGETNHALGDFYHPFPNVKRVRWKCHPLFSANCSERARRLRRALVQYVKPTLNERFGSIGCASPRR